MDSIQIDFDFLARETIALSEVMIRERVDREKRERETETEKEEKVATGTIKYPEAPGIIFIPEFGKSTFCIRGLVSTNLYKTQTEIQKGNATFIKKLKIPDNDLSKLDFFQTSTVELSEIIHDQIINRRIPFYEELICNISDPGFSWWMEFSEFGLKINFKSYSVDRDKDSIKLGPIGDKILANLRFNEAKNFLLEFLELAEFSINDSSFAIRTKNQANINFENFKDLFLFGNSDGLFKGLENKKLTKTLSLYFSELETLRLFWLKIEKKLALEQILKQV